MVYNSPRAITFRQFRMQFNEDEFQFDDVPGNIVRGARTCQNVYPLLRWHAESLIYTNTYIIGI